MLSSGVAARLTDLIAKQIRNRVNLVKGVESDIQNLSGELKRLGNTLDDAERREFKDKSVKDWLRKLEDASYEMDDVLDEWNISIVKLQQKKVGSFIPFPNLVVNNFAIRYDIALKIIEVKKRLDLIFVERDRFDFVASYPIHASREPRLSQTTSLIDLAKVCGRESENENLVDKLMSVGGSRDELDVCVLSIVGPGGIGKTTLAKLAYNDSRVKNCFQLRIWICVSRSFDEVGIANEIIFRVGGSKPNTNQLDMLLRCLKELISGKKFLLVLDDVWIEDNTKWEPLKNSLKQRDGVGSKILVTTRNQCVAVMIGSVKNEIHHLGSLSDDECWLLLSRIAFSGKNEEECKRFHNIGNNIAKKCKGLPLAAKTLGSLLLSKNTLKEWENVMNSKIWELEKVEIDIFSHLLISYNELSPTLKRCFSYCAVFPKDTKIDLESVVTKWMAMGYLESRGGNGGDWKVRGRENFDKLAMLSLFQNFKSCGDKTESFKMHDILHDFALFLRKNGRVGAAGMKKTTCQACNILIVSQVQEYRSLFNYKELPNPHLCDCLARVRLLSLRKCGLRGIPKQIKKLIHLRWLNLGRNNFHDQDVKTVCKLYNLQFLWLDMCQLERFPRKLGIWFT
ncbi:PREDICTED: putative disease resistance protein RGA3 [Erythranthe guttata]|uniref:putative disease resistance protein RGA3 n=1 Tax=Erythranthe guttata TaxID=4155 RepID=UPI00064D8A07|nr:PREDICTED: putative disease resistance protein RGA3 [Erythranthe guttata]|eukprot:XP_012856537.1 PREDICTED: putative disease resistance protein RGA3 [Erythranthe guttata]